MAAILIDVAEAIVAAIEAKRQASDYVRNDFLTDWDFESRAPDTELTDNDLHVRVIVPNRFEQIERNTKAALEWWASFFIDVRQKLGPLQQDTDQTADRDNLADLVELVEQIHLTFFASPWLTSTRNIEWVPSHDTIDKRSEIQLAYSADYLREDRLFYGCLKELFHVTA